MKKILLIDDDSSCLEMCSLMLTEFGFETIQCHTFEFAAKQIEKTTPDLVISDFLGLDNETGIEFFVDHIMGKNIPFALWTGTVSLEDELLVNEFRVFLNHLPTHIKVDFDASQGVRDGMLKVSVSDLDRNLTQNFPCFSKPSELTFIISFFSNVLNGPSI